MSLDPSRCHSVAVASLAGLKCLIALKKGTPLSEAAAVEIHRLLRNPPDFQGTTDDLAEVLEGESEQKPEWLIALAKARNEVVRLFLGRRAAGPRSIAEQAIGQMMESTTFATSAYRAGARSHLQLSQSQQKAVFAEIHSATERDELVGTVGTLICVTNFRAALILQLPLGTTSDSTTAPTVIDVPAGLVRMNYAQAIKDAAKVLPGSIASSYECVKPLPTLLVDRLKTRMARFPDAKCLADLYPAETLPPLQDAIGRKDDQIPATWARLRRSTGTALRELGLDGILAGIASGDFRHIPHSKLYYASVAPEEIDNVFRRVYLAVGWSEPTPLPKESIGFGCRVVPMEDNLKRIDKILAQQVHYCAPGKNSGVPTLLRLHNAYVVWAGWRLALLLGLRESSVLPLTAANCTESDTFVLYEDKPVAGRSGMLPVPLCQAARACIKLVLAHCQALHDRLQRAGAHDCGLARACAAICDGRNVPLLFLATSLDELQPVGTRDLLDLPTGAPRLAPDFGRKAIENLLRSKGLRGTEIDAMLRHSVDGQHYLSAASTSVAPSWAMRVTRAVDELATELLSCACVGLSKG